MKNISLDLYCGFLLLLITAITLPAAAQNSGVLATQADSLRGYITPQRAWWEVVYYDLNVTVMPEDSTISGYNNITYRVTGKPARLQVDLQDPLEIDQIEQDGTVL